MKDRAQWEEYLVCVPTDQLLEELVNRRGVPLVCAYLDDVARNDPDVLTYDSGGDFKILTMLYLALGDHLWKERSYGEEETEPDDGADDSE